MTRDISNDNQTASEASTIAPVLFLDLGFDNGTVRMHSWLGDITWDGNTYTGIGQLGAVSPVEEDAELTRTPLKLTLSGIPTAMISIVLNEQYQGRSATLYLGYLNPSTLQLINDPLILYRGRMDTADIEQGENLTVTLSVESRFAAWDRPLVRRYNNADQQSRYPGDRGLEFVEQSTEKQIVWGGIVPT